MVLLNQQGAEQSIHPGQKQYILQHKQGYNIDILRKINRLNQSGGVIRKR